MRADILAEQPFAPQPRLKKPELKKLNTIKEVEEPKQSFVPRKRAIEPANPYEEEKNAFEEEKDEVFIPEDSYR